MDQSEVGFHSNWMTSSRIGGEQQQQRNGGSGKSDEEAKKNKKKYSFYEVLLMGEDFLRRDFQESEVVDVEEGDDDVFVGDDQLSLSTPSDNIVSVNENSVKEKTSVAGTKRNAAKLKGKKLGSEKRGIGRRKFPPSEKEEIFSLKEVLAKGKDFLTEGKDLLVDINIPKDASCRPKTTEFPVYCAESPQSVSNISFPESASETSLSQILNKPEKASVVSDKGIIAEDGSYEDFLNKCLDGLDNSSAASTLSNSFPVSSKSSADEDEKVKKELDISGADLIRSSPWSLQQPSGLAKMDGDEFTSIDLSEKPELSMTRETQQWNKEENSLMNEQSNYNHNNHHKHKTSLQKPPLVPAVSSTANSLSSFTPFSQPAANNTTQPDSAYNLETQLSSLTGYSEGILPPYRTFPEGNPSPSHRGFPRGISPKHHRQFPEGIPHPPYREFPDRILDKSGAMMAGNMFLDRKSGIDESSSPGNEENNQKTSMDLSQLEYSVV